VLLSLSTHVFGQSSPPLEDSRMLKPESLAFQRPSADGSTINVVADPAVPATVVCFVGTECPVARFYVARLSDMATEFRARGVRFVGLDSNLHDTHDDLLALATELKVSFPLAMDRDNVIADAYHAKRTPEVVLLDAGLNIVYRGRVDDQMSPGVSRGSASRDDLRIAIEELLAGKPVAVPQTEAAGCLMGRTKKPSGENGSSPTWAREVSRVLQRNCVECHRTGEIGPFSLDNYDDARGWADMSMEVIDQGRMPPWHADPAHGQFANARVMPEADKQTLRNWMKAGTPFGNEADLPEALPPARTWQLAREPDLVLPMRSRPFTVPAGGTVEYQYFVVDPKFTTDRWVSGAQVIPGARAVVHHAIVFIRPPDGAEFRGVGWLTAYVPGQRLSPLPAGFARKVPAGSKLVFQMHYTPNGAAADDVSQVGMIFADESDVTHELITVIAIDQEFEIPPHAPAHDVRGQVSWYPKNGLLLAVAPHMHVRGKSFELALERGDQSEPLLNVPRYDFNWQHSYELRQPIPLADVTRMPFTATFDNSADNPFNPDPTQWVNWGDQTWEEMAVAFLEVAEPRDRATELITHVAEANEPDPERQRRVDEFINDFFQRLDANADGKVLRAEVPLAVRNSFWRYDANNDLEADREEVRAVAERRISR
jgi:peroxiredoxin